MVNINQLGLAVLERTFVILKAPIAQPAMLWILIPLLGSILLMTIYFGRYKYESMSWDSAFGNMLVLIFASIDLLRFLHNQGTLFETSIKNLVVAVFMVMGVTLTFLNYFHLMPEELAFGISSGNTVNIIVLFLIIVVYSQIPIDYVTALAVLGLMVIFFAILKLIQVLEIAPEEEDGN